MNLTEASMPHPINATNDDVDCQKPHVLIVDDDYDMTDLLKIALDRSGYRTTIAHDGNQGLAIAEAKAPDLMILDIMMPRRSGFLVLERLRQVTEIPIPVIIITGNFGERHRTYAEMLGVSAYFHKPIKVPVILDKIEELLDNA